MGQWVKDIVGEDGPGALTLNTGEAGTLSTFRMQSGAFGLNKGPTGTESKPQHVCGSVIGLRERPEMAIGDLSANFLAL